LWYNGGMEPTGWITLVAVIVALGLGLSSLFQTQRLQKRERRERLLNEIIEWAIELNKCAWESGRTISAGLSSKEFKLYAAFYELIRFKAADAKSEYIRSIASTFREDLHSNVEQVKKQLDNFIDLKFENIKSRNDEEKLKLAEKTKKSEKELYELVEVLQKTAAKIKTAGIG